MTELERVYRQDGNGNWGWHTQEATGGGLSVNWAKISLANCPALNTGNGWFYNFQSADITIDDQSGSDFSIGPDGVDGGTVLSIRGGVFTFAPLISGFNIGVTLDGSSARLRTLQFGAVTGDPLGPPNPANGLGLDVYIPVYSDTTLMPGNCVQSSPGIGVPGGVALTNLFFYMSGIGTDEIAVPLNGFAGGLLCQIG